MARDLVKILDELAKDKNISPEVIQNSLAEAITRLEKNKYGYESDIKTFVTVNKDSLDIKSYQNFLIVTDDFEHFNPIIHIKLNDAIANYNNSLEDFSNWNDQPYLGGLFKVLLPPLEINRTNLYHLTGIFNSKIQEIQSLQEYEEFKDKVGQIVCGQFKHREGGNIIVSLGKTEAMIPRNELLPPWENFSYNDLVCGYIYDVQLDKKKPQVLLSRTHPQFVVKLFEQEVPEIANKTIEIKAIAREAGSRTKLAVYSHDKTISPVGTCIGVRGFRVNTIIKELKGEKIDIVNWHPNIAKFVVSSLVPGEVIKVVVNEQRGKIEVVVKESQLSLIIGPGGQNVRLASKLTGVDIEIMTEAQENEMRHKDLNESINRLIAALDVDEMIAHILYNEDFYGVDDIIASTTDELAKIEGFNSELAEAIRERAIKYKENERLTKLKELQALGVKDDLLSIKHMNYEIACILARNNIRTAEELAELSIDELIDPHVGILASLKISEKVADEMIMHARSPWFLKEEDDTVL